MGAGIGALAGSSFGDTIAGWFSDPEDQIPDIVKEQGPIGEAAYIKEMLESGKFDEEQAEGLREYRQRLLSDSNLDEYLERIDEEHLSELPATEKLKAFDAFIRSGELDLNANPDVTALLMYRANVMWGDGVSVSETPRITSAAELEAAQTRIQQQVSDITEGRDSRVTEALDRATSPALEVVQEYEASGDRLVGEANPVLPTPLDLPEPDRLVGSVTAEPASIPIPAAQLSEVETQISRIDQNRELTLISEQLKSQSAKTPQFPPPVPPKPDRPHAAPREVVDDFSIAFTSQLLFS